MKVRLLILILFLATILIKNAESVSQPKLNKTFDEIFGKGWDAEVPEFAETKEWHKMETPTTEVENKSTDQPNPNEQSFSDHFESFANRIIRERFDEMFDENWSEDDNEFVEEDETDSTDQNVSIDGQKCQKVQKNGDPGTKLIKRRKNHYSDQKKREIIEEFILLTEKYKQKRKHSRKEWHNIYAKITKSIGVSLRTIKKWKNEFGQIFKPHTNQQRLEKLKQYCEIKRNNPKIIDFELAKSLNIGGSTLRQWKKELKNADKDENNCSIQKELDQITPYKFYSDQQKLEILKQFDKIKSKCKQAKLNNISMHKFEDNICKKLGVSARTIYEWKRKYGISVSNKKFSELEKRKILKQFDKIKSKCQKAKLKSGSNHELDEKIAKKLGVSASTIHKWKREFGLSVSNKISDATKIGILKKYAKIKEKNPKMTNAVIADMLNISSRSLSNWKKQFQDGIKNV